MGNVEIPKWLKGLPLAPEFRPTDTEFADPIAYISKIEKEASAFGICKIIPPLPKPSKRYVFNNLNKSLLKCPELGDDSHLLSPKVGSGDDAADGDSRAVFTTRHQELGQSLKRAKGVVKENPQLGVHKQVWQSGEIYTLEQFESKSKAFARSLLGMIKEINPLVIEALFWKAASEKPIYVEYANDVPGSGFGEPEGQFQYFRRRRRKRASYQSYRRRRGNLDCRNNEMDNVKSSHNDELKDASIKNEPSLCSETASGLSSTTFIEDGLKSSKPKSVTASNDMEGTAGWKLSNSPWNLQVIARSPGSLTRFMPDDIPGVTSPMVYIGMLFSWFAWHVEDHELHSMNFLHTGSAKTWYAVPGDYAFSFEEVIRTQAYGGNYDRLAALTLLGEKTTILSPEVILSSGIPCCRLVQNPGEFVVTFPRAYHVGFSHGFNCGEAANFGTPQWLDVAKEAAVRRAAMNYLPMLSHQQLLYLLTMSFVSRVPRSLLPGARNSRLRDRQREERELSVKKAFIEDLLKENDILSVFLAKESICPLVIWNPDLLPCASKDCQLPSITSTPKENASHIHFDSNTNNSESDLLKEMSLYMETLNDLYMEDDDLSSDFQVDSGTLACVACGILGFPFMSVVQPSERASIELMTGNHVFAQGEPEVTRTDNEQTSSELDSTAKGSISDGHTVQDLSLSLKDLPMPTGWNTSTKFLRPRVFCLEHGVQIEELLQSKGGANMLIICHSDFQKMKAQAAAIAEEIGSPFNYNEVPLGSASQEVLNLINLAIDDEDHHECGEDWTSRLGINLQYCVKIRKNSPSKQVQHALALEGLFSYKSPSSHFLNIKWQSRRSRSRIKLNQPAYYKPCNISVTNKNEVLGNKSDDAIVKKEKLIQYTRRNYRVKIDYSTNGLQGCSRKPLTEVLEHSGNDPDKHTEETSLIYPCSIGNVGSESTGLDFSLILDSDMLHEVQVLEATGDLAMGCASSQAAGPLLTAAVAVESVLGQSENQFLEESSTRGDIADVKASSSSQIVHELNASGGTNENDDSYATKCCSTFITAANERCEMRGEDQTVGNVNNMNETSYMVSEGQHMVLDDGDISMDEVSDLANPESSIIACTPVGQMENVVEKSCIDKELRGLLTLDNEVQQELETTSRTIGYQYSSCNDTPIKLPTASTEERCDCQQESCAAEDKTQLEIEITDRIHQELLILSNVRSIIQPTVVPVDGSTETYREPNAAVNLYNEVALENGEERAFQTTNENNKELTLRSVTQMEIDQTTASSELSNLCGASTLDTVIGLEIPLDRSTVDRVAPNSVIKQQDYPLPVSTEEFSESEARKEICATVDLSACVNLEPEVQLELHSSERMSGDFEVQKMHQGQGLVNEEPVSTHATLSNEPTPYPIQNCFVIEDESGVRKNSQNCNDVCSQEIESIESTTVDSGSTAGNSRKRKKEVVQLTVNKSNCSSFIRSPCEGLRSRAGKDVTRVSEVNIGKSAEDNRVRKRARKEDVSAPLPKRREITTKPYKCGLEGCHMRFETKAELQLHKRNRCTYEGCGKKFSSHKYAIIHQRVHEDDRPLKCPWKGCSMSFKWAWARTEHIRVHTGEKPYQCKVEGCGLSFRFVSDFSRHRRKTGHFVDPPA